MLTGDRSQLVALHSLHHDVSLVHAQAAAGHFVHELVEADEKATGRSFLRNAVAGRSFFFLESRRGRGLFVRVRRRRGRRGRRRRRRGR